MPAQGCETRTQHELFSSLLPSRSQWNCTFTRPYLSVQISSPAGPTTIAVCGPCTTGFGVMRGGRYGRWLSIAVKAQLMREAGAERRPAISYSSG